MKSRLKKSLKSLIESFKGHLDSLLADESTSDYILDLLSQSEISDDEKQETIQGILELHHDSSKSQDDQAGSTYNERPSKIPNIQESVSQFIKTANDYLSNPNRSSHSTASSPPNSPSLSTQDRKNFQKSTEDQDEDILEKLRRKTLISTYGHVAEPEIPSTSVAPDKPYNDLNSADDPNQPSKEFLDEQLKLLSLKKKQRKKIESKRLDDPLLRPNLNSALVDHENKLRREEAAAKAKAKVEKNKADLIKQRETQLKKKAEARAKSAKLERRA
ncbi:hypothetical protein O181_055646 [Austropuccinia psidii MF-1]|uniref:Uncharacterized protein n=1 Tax=Austropuccinia psidii MF-1 TaxID=1389203 RepID=A0A9Q3EBS2_9BASI|nr:hypothetical protein [Austropuccinia psidii MF-1]